MKDFSRSQAVTVKVVISRKRCKIETLCITDQQSNRSISDDLFKCYFSYSCAAVDKILTDIVASRGPSAIVEILVTNTSAFLVTVCDKLLRAQIKAPNTSKKGRG